MRNNSLIIIALIFSFFSCQEKEDDSYLFIEGISEIDAFYYPVGNIDPDDWNLDDEFTKREKQLFDTLDFSKKGIATPIFWGDSDEIQPCIIHFYPNPFKTKNNLAYYHDDHILNIVVVDNKYNKLHESRIVDTKGLFRFNFDNIDKGIYRMYYVAQDKDYKIVHCGHGDIKKE